MTKYLKVLSSITALILVAVLLVAPLSVSAAAGTKVSLSSSVETAKIGDTVKITASGEKITAFALSIEIDLNDTAFEVEKVSVSNSALSDIQAGLKKGVLVLNWITSAKAGAVLPAGQWFTFEFKVTPQAEFKTETFSIKTLELYDKDLNSLASSKGSDATVTIVQDDKTQNVIDAENAIDAIGTVTKADKATLDKITDAQLAYNKCNAKEQKLVSNYDVLEDAIDKYNDLVAKQNKQDADDKIAKMIADFKNEPLLKETVDTVDATDLAEANKLIGEYSQFPLYVRNKLKPEYEHLLALKEKALALYDAPGMVKGFKETYAGVLELKPETFAFDEETFGNTKKAIEDAINTYGELNSVAQGMLTKEYELLVKLLEKAYELEADNAPESASVIREYNAFRKKYLRILYLTEGEVTADDLGEINQAISELKSLRAPVAGKLIPEYEHLMNLLATLNGAGVSGDGGYADDGTIDTSGGITQYVQGGTTIMQVPVEVESEKADAAGGLLSVIMSPSMTFGLIVFILLMTALILFAAPVVTYFIVKKKSERRVSQ